MNEVLRNGFIIFFFFLSMCSKSQQKPPNLNLNKPASSERIQRSSSSKSVNNNDNVQSVPLHVQQFGKAIPLHVQKTNIPQPKINIDLNQPAPAGTMSLYEQHFGQPPSPRKQKYKDKTIDLNKVTNFATSREAALEHARLSGYEKGSKEYRKVYKNAYDRLQRRIKIGSNLGQME